MDSELAAEFVIEAGRRPDPLRAHRKCTAPKGLKRQNATLPALRQLVRKPGRNSDDLTLRELSVVNWRAAASVAA
jgi:hypothetical protein